MLKGKWSFENNGIVIGEIHEVAFMQRLYALDPYGGVADVTAPGWILLIEEHATGQLIERFAEGLIIRLRSPSSQEPDSS
jgi:hypothetical protein